jgi:hypothetical protein
MVPIDSIVCDVRVYPRISRLDETTAKYASAMKKGDKFPPIVVTRINSVLYLVDGYHRLNAALKCRYREIEAQEIRCRSLAEAYAEGAKRNATHGAPFEQAELVLISSNLKYMGYSSGEISDILRISTADVERNIIKTIERAGPVLIRRRIEQDEPKEPYDFNHRRSTSHRMLPPTYDYDRGMVDVLAEAAHKLWVEHMTGFAKSYKIPVKAVEQLKRRTVPFEQLSDADRERYQDWAKRTLARMQFSG